MMKENLGQRFKSMTCGHTLFVFQKVGSLSASQSPNSQPFCFSHFFFIHFFFIQLMQYEKLSYLVVSDQGESEMFLRSLLRQVTAFAFSHEFCCVGLGMTHPIRWHVACPDIRAHGDGVRQASHRRGQVQVCARCSLLSLSLSLARSTS
jgi:hypothetical protein